MNMDNPFWSNLQTDKWLPIDDNVKHNAGSILTTLDLNLLTDHGFNQNYDKSFFHYKGSESTPPC